MAWTSRRIVLPARTMQAVVIGAAVALSGGCAMIKRFMPWGGSDETGASTATSVPAGVSTAPGGEGGTAEVSPTASSGAGNGGDVRLDLSIPRQAAPESSIAMVEPSARTVTERNNTGEDDTGDWTAEIQSAVHRNWLRPSGPRIPADFSCDVLIQLTRSGIVESARLTRDCGHPTLDASVISAVQAASPLPLPADMGEFTDTLLLTFSP